MEYPCGEYSFERHRRDRLTLDPPLRLLPDWCIGPLGAAPLVTADGVFVWFKGEHKELIRVARLDPETAAVAWSYEPSRPIKNTGFGSGVIYRGGLLLGEDDELLHIDLATGRLRDRMRVPRSYVQHALVAGDWLVCNMWDGSSAVGCYDLAARKLCWKRPVLPGTKGLAYAGNVAVMCDDQAFIALALDTGAERWRFDVTELGRYEDVVMGPMPGRPNSNPIIAGNHVFGAVYEDHVISLDLETGEVRWIRKVPDVGSLGSLTYYPDGRLCVIDDGFATLEASTGEVVSLVSLKDQLRRLNTHTIWSVLAVTENYVYCGSRHKLLAVHKTRGTIDWHHAGGPTPFHGGPVALDRRLYAVDLAGNLRVFEPTAPAA